MYISHSSKIPGQPRDELQWEEEEEDFTAPEGSGVSMKKSLWLRCLNLLRVGASIYAETVS